MERGLTCGNMRAFLNLLMAASLVALCSCMHQSKKITQRFFALDTVIDVTLYSDSPRAKDDLDSLERLVTALDTQLSISTGASSVYRINHRASALQEVSGPLKVIMAVCREEWRRSGGLFDVTVGPFKYLYGLESHQEKHHVPDSGELVKALSCIGFGRIEFINDSILRFPPCVGVDLGGIAKGHVLEQARRFLLSKGHASFMVNLGGDLIVNGLKPDGTQWNIGIRDPRSDEQTYIARLAVSDIAVFTSGDYERFFIENGKRYHHLFNPKTGLPGSCNRSATVVGKDPLAVDAVVKTAFLMPAPDALSYLDSRGMRGFIVDSLGNAWASKGVKDILTVVDSLRVNYR